MKEGIMMLCVYMLLEAAILAFWIKHVRLMRFVYSLSDTLARHCLGMNLTMMKWTPSCLYDYNIVPRSCSLELCTKTSSKPHDMHADPQKWQ